MSTRRQCLAEAKWCPTTNAGLWLDRFILEQATGAKESRPTLVREVADVGAPPEYPRWFARWQQALSDHEACCRVAEVRGRMAVGLGAEAVLETSIALHRTYGVPYIQGSALKGLAAGYARQYLESAWQADTPAYDTVFGNTTAAGYVTFFDALPLPNQFALRPDVLTVHHKEYYQGRAGAPPADWDAPNPVPFLSASGSYLVALSGPADWVGATYSILEHALAELGWGATTSAGSGRWAFAAAPPARGGAARIEGLLTSIRALRPNEVASGIQAFYEQWRRLEASAGERRQVAEAILAKVKDAGREKQSREKEWYRELLATLP